MRFLATIFLALSFLTPSVTNAEELNAGFVQGIWYSTPTVFADTPVRIYVALRNNTDRDLTGTVRFNDNGKRVGTAYVSALPGRIVEAWADWTPSYGEHTINASLFDVKLHTLGERSELVEVESTLAEDIITVDYDTDKDGIGNKEDSDDDNDTISDTDEATQGTNPLVFDKPKTSTYTESDAGSTVEKNNLEQEKNDADRTATDATANSTTREGLEKYTGDGVVDDLLSNVTEKVTGTKESLDAYRAKREVAIDTYFDSTSQTASQTPETLQDAISSASSSDYATITRSRIEKDGGFIRAVWDSARALVGGFYTLLLWALSGFLAHPALVQLILLVGILYIVYRTARKFGRRQGS